MPCGPHCFWSGGMWIMPIVCMLGMMLVAGILFLIFRGGCCGWAAGPGRPTNGTEDALDILKKRYARGEITKEQFEQMKKDIEG